MKSFTNAISSDLMRTFFGFKEVLHYKDWSKMLTPEALDLVGGNLILEVFFSTGIKLAN